MTAYVLSFLFNIIYLTGFGLHSIPTFLLFINNVAMNIFVHKYSYLFLTFPPRRKNTVSKGMNSALTHYIFCQMPCNIDYIT